MNRFVKSLIIKQKTMWSNKLFTGSAIIGFLLFFASFFVNYGAIRYSTENAGNATTDILLQYLPVINTDFIFSGGPLLFALFVLILFILEPKIIPFTLKSAALFIIIRAFFVSMTHLAPPLGYIATDLSALKYFSSAADLFFSGHTGLPFLMALLFWESNKPLRRFFLACSIIAGAAVLLGHLHYTIDVFSAFFITVGKPFI